MRLFFDVLSSPAGKGLTSWLSFVMSNCEVSIGILGQVWCLIVSISDPSLLSYLYDYYRIMYTTCSIIPKVSVTH